jgi:ribosome modulation factor
MLQIVLPWVLLCVPVWVTAQAKPFTKKNLFTDSLTAVQFREQQLYDLPVITLNESDRYAPEQVFISSPLSANRDVLLTVAGFHFSQLRFRPRGYDGSQFSAAVNGIQMNDPDNGYIQWGLWSGLTEATRNRQLIRATDYYASGNENLGGLTVMDMRASKQRVQTEAGYTFSNRSMQYGVSLTKAWGFNKHNWAFAFSAGLRTGSEGYFEGTPYDGQSFYFAADKKINESHLFSLILFRAATLSGRPLSVLQESVALAGSHTYNPGWGYQSGRKRSANMIRTDMPVCIITHEYRISNQTKFTASIGIITGERSSSALDWYDAPDPRPDYYRYLPSFQQDSMLRASVATASREDKSLQQINWQHLYEVNRNSLETVHDADGVRGSSYTGSRSHYWLSEKVNRLTRTELAAVYDTRLNNRLAFSAGVSLQYQNSRRFKRVADLLGGDYILDINAFAEDNTGGDSSRKQNDLYHPNRLVHAGEKYGYDYIVSTMQSKAFFQLAVSHPRTDFFASLHISTTAYSREGRMQNGLFPYDSYGKTEPLSFTEYSCKAGLTYKINGRRYVYLQAASMNRAPLFDDIFIAPACRNTMQDNIRNTSILHAEAGYIINTPVVKSRISAYITGSRNGINVMSFYHDGYGMFVNYALNGIGKIHYGLEAGADLKINGALQLVLAASAGRYYYDTRQKLSVSSDDDAYVLERTMVYAKNYRVEGTPQEAYSAGLSYRSAHFYCSITQNYFREQWLGWNPLRRTYAVMENVQAGSELWDKILVQTRLPDQAVLDLAMGGSVGFYLPGNRQKKQAGWNFSVNNLLNRQDLIAGGYEQLRFDAADKDPQKFLPKYYYAMGLNFSFHIFFRL